MTVQMHFFKFLSENYSVHFFKEENRFQLHGPLPSLEEQDPSALDLLWASDAGSQDEALEKALGFLELRSKRTKYKRTNDGQFVIRPSEYVNPRAGNTSQSCWLLFPSTAQEEELSKASFFKTYQELENYLLIEHKITPDQIVDDE
jgi:hypothetical protein